MAMLEKEVIPFSDYKRHIRRHRDCAGDGFFNFPAKCGSVNCFVVTLLTQAPQKCDIPRTVKRIFRTFAGSATEPCEFDIRKMKPVHRHNHCLSGKSIKDCLRQC